MLLRVLRYCSRPNYTLGLLFDATNSTKPLFLCYTLEDEYRLKKVSAETRIPKGTYEVLLRKEGTHHESYSKKFSDIHEGMLWVQNVPGFQWILIHVGNTESDTGGCLLVGSAPTADGRLLDSTRAYKMVYVHVLEALKLGKRVYIEYVDYDSAG